MTALAARVRDYDSTYAGNAFSRPAVSSASYKTGLRDDPITIVSTSLPSEGIAKSGVEDNIRGLATRIAHLSNLGENWDSYGAKSVSSDSAIKAFMLGVSIAESINVPLTVNATPRGGIEITLNVREKGVIIEFEKEHPITALFYDDASSREKEYESISMTDLLDLIRREFRDQ